MGRWKGREEGMTSIPVPCPHCHKFVYNPPNWIRVLEAMFALRKKFGSAVANQTALAEHLGVTRERGRQLMNLAIHAGVVESFIKFTRVFKPSQRGYLYYRAWRRAGWEGKRVPTQQQMRTSVVNTGLTTKKQRISRLGGVCSELAAAIAVLKTRDKERSKA